MNDPHATFFPAGGGASVVPVSRPAESSTLEYSGVRELERRAVTRYAATVPEESLVVDDRSAVTPAQMVESKLMALLQGSSLPVSHLQMRGLVRGRPGS